MTSKKKNIGKSNLDTGDKDINILIICEGKNTERMYLAKYFKLLVKKIFEKEIEDFYFLDPYGEDQEGKFKNFRFEAKNNDGNTLSVIHIQIEHTGKTDPLGIVNQGNERSSNYDYVYCVFDKDGHVEGRLENYNKAMRQVIKKNVTIINSIPFFELFIALHFKYTTSENYCNNSSDDFIKNVLKKEFKLEYSKTCKDFYKSWEKIKDKISNGINNSIKLSKEDFNIKTNFHILLIDLFKIFTEKVSDEKYITKNKNDSEVIKVMKKIFE